MNLKTPERLGWITSASRYLLKTYNGNSKGVVPIHAFESATANIEVFDTQSISPLYTEIAKLKAELEELRKDCDLLQFCIDNDAFPVKDQSGAYIMSKNNEFFSVSDSPRKSIELAFEYVKYKADNVMRGEK